MTARIAVSFQTSSGPGLWDSWARGQILSSDQWAEAGSPLGKSGLFQWSAVASVGGRVHTGAAVGLASTEEQLGRVSGSPAVGRALLL